MLISESSCLELDAISALIGRINGNTAIPHEISNGVYIRPDFGSSSFLNPGYKEYPRLKNIGCYGVCDNYQQILDLEPDLTNDPNRKFVIRLTSVKKANQSEQGGWRWHKWGEYIGVHEITTEYIYDEPIVEEVFCYHIYEKI